MKTSPWVAFLFLLLAQQGYEPGKVAPYIAIQTTFFMIQYVYTKLINRSYIMDANKKMDNIIIGTIKTVMRGRDFEVDIQPVGENTLETIMGKSRNGEFKIVYERDQIYVNANGQERVFKDKWSEAFKLLISEIKHQNYGYRNTHYYSDGKGNWIKMPAKTGFFARMFRKGSK